VEIEGEVEGGGRNGRRHWKIGGEQRKQHVWVGFSCAFDKNTLFFLSLWLGFFCVSFIWNFFGHFNNNKKN
jgi:hypothetical protein